MSQTHNDNEASSFKNNNVNDNEDKGMRRLLNADRIAMDLVKLFGSTELPNPKDDKSWNFYCNVANKLPESEIRNNIESATRKSSKPIRNPGGYFNRLCQVSLYKMKTNV